MPPRLTPDPSLISSGFCQCGCGRKTRIASHSIRERNQFIGYPRKYVRGHSSNRGKRGSDSTNWKGGRTKNPRGYWSIYQPDHHLANRRGYVLEHRLVWEQANGRELKPKEVVHHIDGNPGNNSPENLVALTTSAHTQVHIAADPVRHLEKLKRARKKFWSDSAKYSKQSEAMKRAWAAKR